MSICLKAYLKKNVAYVKSWTFVTPKENPMSVYRGRFWKCIIARLLMLVWKGPCIDVWKPIFKRKPTTSEKKPPHTYAHGGSLLVQSRGAVALYVSIYMINTKNKNNCHPQSNVVLEKMSERNYSPEISRMPQAQNFFLCCQQVKQDACFGATSL